MQIIGWNRRWALGRRIFLGHGSHPWEFFTISPRKNDSVAGEGTQPPGIGPGYGASQIDESVGCLLFFLAARINA
jgi:hypothetical protein